MTRPGFALSVLLVTFSGLLVAVRAANGQQVDGRIGGVKYGLCPLIENELYDGGYRIHVCDVSNMRDEDDSVAARVPLAKRFAALWQLSNCSVSEWFRAWPQELMSRLNKYQLPVEVKEATPEPKYLSGYDQVYDNAVYGAAEFVDGGCQTAKSVAASGHPIASTDWAGWDWCGGECGGYQRATAAPAVAASIEKPMEREPESIEEYYSMYGVPRPETVDADNHQGTYEDNYGYTPAGSETVRLSDIVGRWINRDTILATMDVLQSEYISRRDQFVHRLMVSRYWPQCAELYRTWNKGLIAARGPKMVPGAEKACGRVAVLTIAKSLNQAAVVLQNASRRLTQLVENPPVEVSTTSNASDQR